MSDNITPLLLIGTGSIARDYAKILSALDYPFTAVGRSEGSCKAFEKDTGVKTHAGGLKAIEELTNKVAYNQAIVACSVNQLTSVMDILIEVGTPNILLEKPGATTPDLLRAMHKRADKKSMRIVLGYNRRFYNSVRQAKEIIQKDGGVLSMHFEFTEWTHGLEDEVQDKDTLQNWFFANSTHIVDMAFHMAGKPKELKAYNSGGNSWHPTATRFTGCGTTETGALFSYGSNWDSPGRWSVEVMTANNRLIFKPLEKLHHTVHRSVAVEEIHLADTQDTDFKPGLYKEVSAFLNKDDSSFKTLADQVADLAIYECILNGGDYKT